MHCKKISFGIKTSLAYFDTVRKRDVVLHVKVIWKDVVLKPNQLLLVVNHHREIEIVERLKHTFYYNWI